MSVTIYMHAYVCIINDVYSYIRTYMHVCTHTSRYINASYLASVVITIAFGISYKKHHRSVSNFLIINS